MPERHAARFVPLLHTLRSGGVGATEDERLASLRQVSADIDAVSVAYEVNEQSQPDLSVRLIHVDCELLKDDAAILARQQVEKACGVRSTKLCTECEALRGELTEICAGLSQETLTMEGLLQVQLLAKEAAPPGSTGPATDRMGR